VIDQDVLVVQKGTVEVLGQEKPPVSLRVPEVLRIESFGQKPGVDRRVILGDEDVLVVAAQVVPDVPERYLLVGCVCRLGGEGDDHGHLLAGRLQRTQHDGACCAIRMPPPGWSFGANCATACSEGLLKHGKPLHNADATAADE
jgi:hypothetical protein